MIRFGAYGLLSVQCLLNRMRASLSGLIDPEAPGA
jgi:hypothetical protein